MFVLDQLLGNGRAPLGQTPLADVGDEGAGDAAHVDAAMLIEAGIFDGEEGLLEEEGNAVEGDPVALDGEDAADELPPAIKDFDRAVIAQQRGRGGDGLLGVRCRDEGQQQEDEGENEVAGHGHGPAQGCGEGPRCLTS